MSRLFVAFAVLFALLGLAAPASAQATRTWVSGVGDDANPCSRTAPCKTFAGAISKTAAGGEISVLDSGGFGAVTITRSINIVAVGGEGGVLASGTNAVTVNAGPADVVTLRGLILEGAGTGTVGVRIGGAGSVNIEDTVIRDFRAGPGAGVLVQNGSAARVTITGSTLTNNQSGVVSESPAAQVWVAGSVITGNAVAMEGRGGAEIHSYGDNVVHANGSDGTGWSKAVKR